MSAQNGVTEIGSRMSAEAKRKADMKTAAIFEAGVTFAGVIDPPKQIHNWNCYVCGFKAESFETYIMHGCRGGPFV